MRIFTLIANCKKPVIACLVMLCGLMIKSEVGWGQTTVPFTTAGTNTWVCPIGVTSITVESWGAGGAGGGVGTNTIAEGGGGGGGGAYSKVSLISVIPRMTYNVIVGSGGNGVNNGDGGNGGNSYFNTNTAIANGGSGGKARNGASGAGGAAGTYKGGNGIAGSAGTPGGGGSSAGTAANGNDGSGVSGGTAPAGGGNGGSGGGTTPSNGSSGSSPGGGGGGAKKGTGSGTGTGGNGANGQVKITYTQPTFKDAWVGMNVGSTNWCPGETRTISVTVKNTGTAAWTDIPGGQDINIGVKWDGDPDYLVRTDVGGLASGATGTFNFTVTAPAAGTNHLTFDVVYEAVSWFGNNNGGVGPGNTVSTSSAITIALPTPTLISSTNNPCSNTNVTYTTESGQTNYIWTFNGTAGTDYTIISGGNSSSNTAVVKWLTPGNKTVTANYTTTGGCSGTSAASKTVSVLAAPTGSLTVSETSGNTDNDGIICTNASVKFTATTGYNTYTFKVNGSIVQSPSVNNIFITNSLVNGDQVTVDVSNSNNCSTTFGPIVITVNPLPTPTLSADKSAICPGDAVIFTAGGGTYYTFNVNGSPVQSSASNTYTATDLTAGNSVTVDAKNANGCTATSSPVSIAINPVPSGMLGATENSGTPNDNKICPGSSITFTATPDVTGTYNYNFKINGASVQNTNVNTFTTTTLANADIVTVEVTNSTGCTASFGPQQVITVVLLPTGSLAPTENSGTNNDNSICPGSPVTFTATAGYSNYAFYLNGTGAPLQNNATRTYTTSALTDGQYITVVVTNSNGCTSTFISPSITVVPTPSGVLSASATTICQGEGIEFTATSGFTNYIFRVNNVVKQIGPSFTFTYSGFVNGDPVTVQATNAQTCSATFNPITITVNPLPTGSIVPKETSGLHNDDGIICSGDSIVFTATAGFANYNFKLNGTSVQNTASNTYTNKTLTNGDKVTVEVTSDKNCIATFAQVTVTVNSLPTVAAITGAAAVCNGSTITLTDASAGGTWSSSNNTIASINASGVVTGKVPGTVTISYTVTNASTCSVTVTKDITVNDVPVVSGVTGKNNVCVGNIIPLADATTGGVWSSSDESKATVDASGNVTGITDGSAIIGYTVTNEFGCSTTKNKTIIVNSLPVVAPITATGPFTVCANSGLQLQDATAGGVWGSSDNTIATVNSVSGLVKGIAGGTATISYTVKDGNNCSTTVTQTVLVNALPQPTLAGPDLICPFTMGVYITEQNQVNYSWIVTGGVVDSAGGPGDYGIKITWGATGPYSVYVNYTDPVTGCSGDTAVTVPNGTVSSPTISGTKTVCAGSAGNIYTTETGNDNYIWNITGGTITSGLGTSTVTVTWNTVGAGLISVNYTLAGGCNAASPTVYSVTVKPLPTATISGTTQVCQNGTEPVITFTGNDAPRPFTFTYTINGVLQPAVTTISTSPSVTVPAPTGTAGIYTYNLVSVSSLNSCSQNQTGSATVTVNALPTATIGGTTAVCKDGAVPNILFTGANGTAPYTFTYNINSGSNFTVTTVSGNSVTVPAPTGTAGTFTYNLVSVQDGSSTACSQAQTGLATITVNPLPTATIAGTTSVCISSASPNVTFTGSGGTAPYTFTYNINGGSPLTALSDMAGIATVPASTSVSGTFIYNLVSVKDASSTTCVQAQTGSATVTVTPASVGGSVTSNATVCSGSNTGTLTLSGNTGNVIRWESSTDNFITITTIANTTGSYTYNNLTATTKFRAVVQSGNCSSAPSVAATITVNAVSAGGTVSGSTSVCSGSNTGTLTLSGNIGNVIRWESSTDNFTTITSIANITSSYSYNNLTVTTKFRAVVQNSPCLLPANSTPATVTVNPLPTATISGTTSVCQNATSPNITFTGGNGTAPYTFTYKINSGTNLTVISTGNTATVAAPTGTVGNYTYTLVSVKDNSSTTCSQNISGQTAIVMVKALPSPPVITPATSSICQSTVLPLVANTAVIWSPVTDLYTNATAVTPYAGQSLTTVYVKPATEGNKTYTAIITNAGNCTSSGTAQVIVKPTPAVSISADYCAVPNKVRLTADSTPVASTYIWSTGETTKSIVVDEAGEYTVTVISAGCSNSATINVANELVTNGDFSAGDNSFSTLYTSRTGSFYNGTPTSGLWPEGDYAVDTSAFSPRNGVGYHTLFHGRDHTTGHGKFMMVNGIHELKTLWVQTVNILPNTTYYFSAWGMNLNPGSPAQLSFAVNGEQRGTIADLNIAPKPTSESQVDTSNWRRFYGTWTSGSSVSSAVISIINLNLDASGNDCGIDDISFSTLSTFVNIESTPGSDAQTVCINSPITNIVYSAGNGGTAPAVTGLPPGVITSWNGVLLTISGTPTTTGNYPYTVSTTGTCQPFTATGYINVQQQTIALSAGSANQTKCINDAITPIVFTIGGSGTGAAVTGLPAGVTGSYDAVTKKFTISGNPSAGGTFIYTVTTSGTCTQATATGKIIVNIQSIAAANPSDTTQTVCNNTGISPIIYNLGGKATSAGVTGLPPGVNGALISGQFRITGTPTASGIYHYTVTTSGTCAPGAVITGTITVKPDAAIVLASPFGSDDQKICVNVPLNSIQYTVSGTAATASVTGVPAGVTWALSGGTFTINGTPTVAGVYNYVITVEGECTSVSIPGKITVQHQTIVNTSGSASPTICFGSTLNDIVLTPGGTATGAEITWATHAPSGISASYSGGIFTISGTANEMGTFDYTVTTTGDCAPATFGGSIKVNSGTIPGSLIASLVKCSSDNVLLDLDGYTGNIQRWESSVDGITWNNISNNSSTLNYPGITVPTRFRALVKDATCAPQYSNESNVAIHNYWVGTNSDNWNTASNWSDNAVASGSCSMYTIPAGTNFSPRLSNDVTVANITIASGANLQLDGHILTINGAFSGTGKLKGSPTSGLVVATSGNAGTVYFDTTAPFNQVKMLVLNAGSSLKLGNDGVGTQDTLNIAAGNATDGYGTVTANGNLNANGVLTLKSDINGTAVVGPSLGTIDNNVTVERYIPPKRSWRLLAVPFQLGSSSQTIRDAWQEGVNNYGKNYSIYNKNPKPGYGTHITGNNNSDLGWDFNTTTNVSYKVWDPSINDWDPVEPPTVTTNISAYGEYYIFVRGSRAVNLSLGTGAPADATVLRATGKLNQVNGAPVVKSYSNVSNHGLIMIGNPYASPINVVDVVHRSASSGVMDSLFYIYDPMLAGSDNTGAYVTYNKGVITPASSPRFPNAAAAAMLQSGQAFMVQLEVGSRNATIEFREADKIAPQAQVFGLRANKKTEPAAYPTIYTNLYEGKKDNGVLVDGVGAAFNKRFSAEADKDDASKQWNFGENIALVRNDKQLAIEMRPMPKGTDTLFYGLYLKQQPYILQIFTANLDAGATPKAWLIDKYLNKRIAVDLTDTATYRFVPNSDTNSYRNRFMLVFKQIKAKAVSTETNNTADMAKVYVESNVKLYPNPVSTNKVTMQFGNMDKGMYEITIYSSKGQKIATRELEHNGGSNSYTLPIEASWTAGVYNISIINENSKKTINLNLVISK